MKKKKLRSPKKNFSSKFARKSRQFLVVLAVLHVCQIAFFKWINPVVTWTQFFSILDGLTFQSITCPLEKISPHLQLAVISSEDQLFAQHNGFDIDSIKKAMAHNQTNTSLRGASTISQQVAKNVFLWQGRSWLRKGLEVYYTFIIEQLYGKKRILELYLNVAEMGPGIYGAESAANHYFHKPAQKLTVRESALIAACLPNPKKFNPAAPTPHMKKKVKWIIGQMNYLKTRPNTKQLLFGK